jgi:DNA-3-methyladenine glycosylase
MARLADRALRVSRLDRSFFARDSLEVAPDLLNLLLVGHRATGRIVEVEAYAGERDPASHAYRGKTPRNATMFGPPGHLYVYLTYGMHFCANVVCGPVGEASAVLLRALAPVDGLDLMRERRALARSDRELCSGPGRLCQALGISRDDDGADLVSGDSDLALRSDGVAAGSPVRGTRVGLSERSGEARALRWRFAVRGDPNVSRPAPSGD